MATVPTHEQILAAQRKSFTQRQAAANLDATSPSSKAPVGGEPPPPPQDGEPPSPRFFLQGANSSPPSRTAEAQPTTKLDLAGAVEQQLAGETLGAAAASGRGAPPTLLLIASCVGYNHIDCAAPHNLDYDLTRWP